MDCGVGGGFVCALARAASENELKVKSIGTRPLNLLSGRGQMERVSCLRLKLRRDRNTRVRGKRLRANADFQGNSAGISDLGQTILGTRKRLQHDCEGSIRSRQEDLARAPRKRTNEVFTLHMSACAKTKSLAGENSWDQEWHALQCGPESLFCREISARVC